MSEYGHFRVFLDPLGRVLLPDGSYRQEIELVPRAGGLGSAVSPGSCLVRGPRDPEVQRGNNGQPTVLLTLGGKQGRSIGVWALNRNGFILQLQTDGRRPRSIADDLDAKLAIANADDQRGGLLPQRAKRRPPAAPARS